MMGRRIRLFLVAGSVLVSVCGSAVALTCASWNLQNYLVQNRFEEGRFRLEYPMPEARKRRIRERILMLQPDILFLQEIGSEAFLSELSLDLRALGLDYAYMGFSGVPGTSRGLAWLSRIAPDSFVFHHPVVLDGDMGSVKRGIQEIAFNINGRKWTFLHVHLKSRYSEDPSDPESRDFRKAELDALLGLANRLSNVSKSGTFLLTGDFNSPFDSPLLGNFRESWMPIPASDRDGSSWTYHHKRSGDKDRIDGFWIREKALKPAFTASLLPASDPAPSDHRMVLLEVE
jgi:endonuclease/exonuclease/phosphatase family metal-dependent hydrolase